MIVESMTKVQESGMTPGQKVQESVMVPAQWITPSGKVLELDNKNSRMSTGEDGKLTMMLRYREQCDKNKDKDLEKVLDEVIEVGLCRE